MNKKLTIWVLLFSFSLCLHSCANNEKNKSRPPEFSDNGKTVDSLKTVYNLEDIEYDNWEEGDATDSCLTVCLINSNKVPSGSNTDSIHTELKGIASAVKRSLASPGNYTSYYIIFVKKSKTNGVETKSHTKGTEIKSTEL